MKVVFALLVAVAAGMVGVAMWFGFVPRPWERYATASDSVLADTLHVAPPTLTPSIAGMDSASVPPPGVVATVPDAPHGVTVADSAAGDVVYHGAGRCVGCHGVVGEGASPLGPSLRDSVWRAADGSRASIERVIAAGAPGQGEYRIAMPSYLGQLSSDDLARVAVYVFTLSHPGAALADSVARPTVPAAPTTRP